MHCEGENCPYCNNNLVAKHKLFIPVYDISTGSVKFWNRSSLYLNQLHKVFDSMYPTAADVTSIVFRITRVGEPVDLNTRYTFAPIAKNTVISYREIYNTWKDRIPDFFRGILPDPDKAPGEYDEPEEITIEEAKRLTSLTCNCCGGAIDRNTMTCNYCGTYHVLPKLIAV